MAAVSYASHNGGQQTHKSAAGVQHALPTNNAPPGTFAPGTKVHVGSHRVVIEKYLSEGGFAHVYVVKVPRGDKYEVAVLKRVAVPDKEALANMRTEVETMKKLQGHTHIVRYIDSHASQLKAGGYEVFLLMEYCGGGGLIDFMNTRLQYRLTEPEILHIFSDVAEGVATMHYLKPPLLHRDLKVENVLISKPPSSSTNITYKLCDFGSTAPPRPAAKDAAEARLIEDDVQRHTTMQYRSPEMIDVWRRQPIDEKSDIWALGVLLYKLCYYTTPFEEVGQMAILNAKFKFPHHPHFSERLRRLISAMLKEDPKQRPNIFQVVQEVCNMRGKSVPIKDIYSGRSKSEDARNQKLPSRTNDIASPPPAVGISQASPKRTKDTIPDVTPMRRGRPTVSTLEVRSSKPSPSPAAVKGDPFAALDSSNYNVRASAVDELSKKFPSLEEFSITTGKREGFNFGSNDAPARAQQARVVGSVAAERARSAVVPPKPKTIASPTTPTTSSMNTTKALPPKPRTDARTGEPMPARSSYISTGTMTSPPPSATLYPVGSRPIWRVPDHGAADGLAQPSETSIERSSLSAKDKSLQPPLRVASQQSTSPLLGPQPGPSRSESPEKPTQGVDRTRSVRSASRPASASYAHSNLDYLRVHETSLSRSPPGLNSRRASRQQLQSATSPEDQVPIKNDTAYLQSLEDSDDNWERERLNTMSLRDQRVNVPLSSSNRGNGLAGEEDGGAGLVPGTYPNGPKGAYRSNRPLSPVAPSEAASEGHSLPLVDASDGTMSLSSHQRHEIERQEALQEERRVADAARAYRNMADGSEPTGLARSSTIQQRMQSLLEEGRQSPVKRTAAGYGHYTDVEQSPDETAPRAALSEHAPSSQVLDRNSSRLGRVPGPKQGLNLAVGKQRRNSQSTSGNVPTRSSGDRRASLKPLAKPKPVGLRAGGFTGPKSASSVSPAISPSDARAEWQSAASSTTQGSRLAALLAKDQEGTAGAGDDTAHHDLAQVEPFEVKGAVNTSNEDAADWQMEFSKRYPSLSGIELVETEISDVGGQSSRRELRIKDV